MVNHKFSDDELLIQLERQTNLLADLCLQFDTGNYDYADVISTKIHTIINFKSKKESLLTNLGKQRTMKFSSTSKELQSIDNVLQYRSLVASTISGGEKQYFPKLNNGNYPVTWKNFKDWATAPILVMNLDPKQSNVDGLIYLEINDETQKIITRENIIIFYRDKFNGAHSDPKIERVYHDIATGIGSAEHLDHPDTKYITGEKYKPGKPVKYLFEMIVRQIAHELIMSIKNEFSFFIKYKPDYRYYTKKRPKNLTDLLITTVEAGKHSQKQLKIDQI